MARDHAQGQKRRRVPVGLSKRARAAYGFSFDRMPPFCVFGSDGLEIEVEQRTATLALPILGRTSASGEDLICSGAGYLQQRRLAVFAHRLAKLILLWTVSNWW